MSFSQAFARAGIKVEQPKKQSEIIFTTDSREIPMMYRAQIGGRCSLQFIANNYNESDLKIWADELVNTNDEQTKKPRYQYSNNQLARHIISFTLPFPFRVISNCGQDSILRPVIDGRGIPIIPGSSIKGLFRRACQRRDQGKPIEQQVTKLYCGDADRPGILRFHPAYPLGDWASTTLQDRNPSYYKILDVVFPQQSRQTGEKNSSSGAFAQVSFSQPTFVFSISSSQSLSAEQCKSIEGILKTALSKGLGGKTSSGYGLPFQALNKPDLQITLTGSGITPSLLTGQKEFRPNMFKAVLRGHATRLLAGCTDNNSVLKDKINALFGSTNSPSTVEMFCEIKNQPQQWSEEFEDLKLEFYLQAGNKNDQEFLKQLFKFSYTMAGLGKSWRRVWHKKFYPNKNYNKLIGCHWISNHDEMINIKDDKQLKNFLDNLYKLSNQYLNNKKDNGSMSWREAWSPKRVAVYSKIVQKSTAIELFHREDFKNTPAIGGKDQGDRRPKHVSSVWHRMLPISNEQYLEIVTVFHGDRGPWKEQLPLFIKDLTDKGLSLTWGEKIEFNKKLNHV